MDIERTNLTAAKLHLLKSTKDWWENKYSIMKNEYASKEKSLSDSFQDLIATGILVDPVIALQQLQQLQQLVAVGGSDATSIAVSTDLNSTLSGSRTQRK